MKKKYVFAMWTILFCTIASWIFTSETIFADLIMEPQEDEFIIEHKDELREYRDEFQDDTEVKKILIWTYPFSGETTGEIEDSFANLPFQYMYMDPKDNELLWGYINDSVHTGWVCLNAPDNPELKGVENDLIIGTPAPKAKQTHDQQKIMVLVAVLILFLILVTAFLMVKFWKKKE